jgi:LETM1 and EF-hand domain-containing protein 1
MFIGRVARITHSLNKRKQRKAIDKLINLTITRQRRLEQQKPALFVTLKNTVIHYYHGFRLFGLEVKVASRLFIKTLRGHSLTRQEQRQVCSLYLPMLTPLTIALIPFLFQLNLILCYLNTYTYLVI